MARGHEFLPGYRTAMAWLIARVRLSFADAMSAGFEPKGND
jgi:hypothetical protein